MLRSRISEADLYDYNKGFLYRYNDNLSKLTVCAKVRKAGYELSDGCRSYTAKGEAGNDEKLPQNIRRAKSKVFELALCNKFTFFCTLTFSQDKVKNRYDLESCMKSFCKWLNNYNYRHPEANVRYLLIPEEHKDSAIHLHGLLSDVPEADTRPFRKDERLPYHILNELAAGHDVFQWISYDRKFGYCTLSPIRNSDAVSKYITKYITKELGEATKALNAHIYYHSKGLRQKELIYSAADCDLLDPDYDGDYCKIKNAASADDLIHYFASNE